MNHALECLFECCKWWQSLASLLKFTYTYMCLRRRRRRRRMQRRPSGAVRDDAAGEYVYTTLHVHTRAKRPHQLCILLNWEVGANPFWLAFRAMDSLFNSIRQG
jgi:hypothetical protein